MSTASFDVIVVGAGNAGLTAALAAEEGGASVLVLEAANEAERGGNSRFTGGIFRTTHNGLDSLKPLLHPENEKWFGRVETSPYTSEDYTKDWMTTSQRRPDQALMNVTIEQSYDTLLWMRQHGVWFGLTADKQVDPDKQEEGTTIGLPPGGALRSHHEGVSLIEDLFRAVESKGIEVWYESPGHGLITEGDTVVGVVVRKGDEFVEVRGQVVLAAGGFEANPEMRLRYLGTGWDLVKVRGTRFNQGAMLTKALDAGAQAVGHWGGAHAVPLDADAPPVGDLKFTDKYSRYSYTWSLLVNSDGQRFIDEGEAHVWLTYAKTGWAIRAQNAALAYQIFDQKVLHLLEPRYSTGTPIVADTLEELAGKLGVDPRGLRTTVDEFNRAVAEDAEDRTNAFDLDGVSAEPVGQPRKSNWARRIDEGPFVAYAVTCGVTFTYGGIQIDTEARVVSNAGKVMPGLYGTGEITGGFFYYNYGAGTGLMRGAVFGRIAGRNAALAAASLREPVSA
jgi:tricarballylate dehydrogenase